MEKRRKWRCGPRPTPKQPQSTCSSLPWNPFSRKAGFSRTALPQLTPQLSLNSPPRPESWRSLPPRWAAAEESCPSRSGCGKRVLAAPCVRREWSCCKMAAEAHAAGSKPDPVPLASERAPGARARPRVTPPLFPPLPSRVRFSLTPSAPALLQLLLSPYNHTTRLCLPFLGLSFSPPCSFPLLLPLPSAAAQARVAAFLLLARTLVGSLPPALALSAPSPSPCRVGSSLSLSRADVTT